MNIIKGSFNGNDKKVGIVAARFNHFVSDALVDGGR